MSNFNVSLICCRFSCVFEDDNDPARIKMSRPYYNNALNYCPAIEALDQLRAISHVSENVCNIQ